MLSFLFQYIKSKIVNLKIRRAIAKFRYYVVGKYTITLPPGHMLDSYQQNFKNYDKKLPCIARIIESKYGEMSVIDIGANVGDTAAALRSQCNAMLICVEGNLNFLQLLDFNLSNLPGKNRVVPKFIGAESSENMGRIITVNGTAHIEREGREESINQRQERIGITTYKELLESNSDLPVVRLVKIDTDGFDFKIILGSINEIAASLPVLFFEFDPFFSPENEKNEALSAVNALIKAGYFHFVIYDNFGNYMFSFSENSFERFIDLFSFLEQSRKNGGGVVYLDVCCFTENDGDIFIRIVESERANIIQHITNSQ